MDDGASKVFLSTKGTLKDVSKDVSNFLAIALEKAYKGKSPYCVKFPMSAVIYLRPDSSVKDFLSLQVYFPDGQALTYKGPVINVQEYSLDGIFDKQLWLFLPFYVMRYEK